MNKTQMRIERIVAVIREYLAAVTASELLHRELSSDPNYGSPVWEQRDGNAFRDNLESTYLVRMYAEFESTLRDYWLTYSKQTTHPKMVQLVNQAIPNQDFPQEWIDNADDVRKYRNHLVHDISEEVPEGIVPIPIDEAKRHMCRYVSRFDASWR